MRPLVNPRGGGPLGRLAGGFPSSAGGVLGGGAHGLRGGLAVGFLGLGPLALLVGQGSGGFGGGSPGLLFGRRAPRRFLGGSTGGLLGGGRSAGGFGGGGLRRALAGRSFRLGHGSGGLGGLGGLLGGGLRSLAPARILALGQLGCQVREGRGRSGRCHRRRGLRRHLPGIRRACARRLPLPGELQE